MENRKAEPGGRADNRHRLREILAVLARHGILRGLTPVKLRLIIQDLGPTFVKLGQILSMRQDMLPAEYCQELTLLRADVSPMPFGEVKEVVEAEYGVPMKSLFLSFEETPLGSASIAQVHAAVLRDGNEVAVKVQRPGVRDTMARDIVLLRRAAGILQRAGGIAGVIDFRMVLDEMWAVAQEEMDFLLEARHMDEFRDSNAGVAYVTCPRVEHRYTTSRALMMEYIDGIPIDDTDRLREEGYDLGEIGEKLADNYVRQILDEAFFHADPHPGNLRIRAGKIVFLDLGMMGRLSEKDRELLKTAVRAVAQNDAGTLKDVLLTLGVHSGKIDHVRLYADIDEFLSRYASMGMADIDLARLMEELLGLAESHGISMPKGLSMLARGIVTIQGVLARISPDIQIITIMHNHMAGGAVGPFDLEKELKSGGLSLLASGRKALDIPSQMSDLLKTTLKGQLKLHVEPTGSEDPLKAAERRTDKLALAILDAALIIGAGLLSSLETGPQILGLPVPAFIGYLLALAVGGVLLFRMRRRKR